MAARVARDRHLASNLLLIVGLVMAAAACGDGLDVADPVPTSTSSATSTSGPTTTTASTLPMLPTTSTTFVDPGVDPPLPVADPGPPPGANSVFVMGDSVFLGTTSSIPIRLSDWVVTYDAEGSRRLAQGIDTLAARRGEIGEAVVIQLGNNYISGERGDYASQIDEAMAVLADVPRVVWVTVSEVSPTRTAINESIRAAADRYPNMWVADWAQVIATEPDLSWDGIHLTPAGRQRMAEVVAVALGPVVP